MPVSGLGPLVLWANGVTPLTSPSLAPFPKTGWPPCWGQPRLRAPPGSAVPWHPRWLCQGSLRAQQPGVWWLCVGEHGALPSPRATPVLAGLLRGCPSPARSPWLVCIPRPARVIPCRRLSLQHAGLKIHLKGGFAECQHCRGEGAAVWQRGDRGDWLWLSWIHSCRSSKVWHTGGSELCWQKGGCCSLQLCKKLEAGNCPLKGNGQPGDERHEQHRPFLQLASLLGLEGMWKEEVWKWGSMPLVFIKTFIKSKNIHPWFHYVVSSGEK